MSKQIVAGSAGLEYIDEQGVHRYGSLQALPYVAGGHMRAPQARVSRNEAAELRRRKDAAARQDQAAADELADLELRVALEEHHAVTGPGGGPVTAAQIAARLAEEADMGEPAPDRPPGPQGQRPGHLLDVLGQIGAARMEADEDLGDRADGTRHRSIVALHLSRAVREGRVFHGALPGAEPTWSLLAAATLAEACAEADAAELRTALLAHAAIVVAWVQALDTRGGAL